MESPVSAFDAFGVQVSPNPVRGTARIQLANASVGPVEITLVDPGGEGPVDPWPHLRSGDSGIELDASGWTPGIYFVRATAAGNTVSRKIVVMR
ncbi:MAG: T9SS type A sorting domain-containing protein [Candidatus Eisenbacteria bacterium]